MRFGNIYNDAFLNEQHEANLVLNEGLITSYPPNKLTDLLIKNFHVGSKNINIGTLNTILFNYNLNIANNKDFLQYLNLCGYTLTKVEVIDISRKLEYTLEPKFPSILRSIPKTFYHVTPVSNLPKIKKMGGLIPRISKTSFIHSGDRIYLFVTQLNSPSDIFKLAYSLHKDRMKRFTGNIKNSNISREYAVLEINPDKSNTYYLDPSLQIRDISPTCFGVFTLRTINITQIKQVGTIKL
jgi:hypothetical protein